MSENASAKPPRILAQLATRLHEIFDGLIDLTDVASKPKDDQEHFFITRAYMALYFLDEVGLTAEQAAACITDGGADDGIDAVYVDKKAARIYFGQSKWRANMQKGVELSDFVRFRDGVRSIIMENWSSDNANIHRFKADIEQQLGNIDTDVVMVLAHTSGQDIAENIQSKISVFIDEENRHNEDFMSFKEFKVVEAAKVARSHTRPENINATVLLTNWGVLSEPYKAVYGAVAASDLVAWFEQNGNKLFAENLRYGIEKSDVNDGIIATAVGEPESFWYYNNGVTAICDSFAKQPIGGPNTNTGVFDVNKISVINGAQTITSLNRAKQRGTDLNRVRVHLRVISLDGTAEDFSSNVTSANNTQNDLSPVDFISADPNQDRIRREALQLNLIYTYRRGDKEPERAHGFTIRSATVAAACASGDLKLAVSAKRYISGLWENPKGEPYTKLFNTSTSASYLWRIVSVMNAVDDALLEEGKKISGRDRLTSVHGNRFILFYVFEVLKSKVLDDKFDVVVVENEARKVAKLTLPAVNSLIATRYPEAYPGNIFKNQERQAELLEALLNL